MRRVKSAQPSPWTRKSAAAMRRFFTLMRPSAMSKLAFSSLNSVSLAAKVWIFLPQRRADGVGQPRNAGDAGERAVGDIEVEQRALQHFRFALAAQRRFDLFP